MAEALELLEFAFVRRAVAAGVCIAFGCGLLGVFLVLKRFSMLGEGLAHFSFGAIGLALLLGWAPLYAALPLAAAAALLIVGLSERGGVFGDAAVGMAASVGIAAGVLFAGMAGGFNVDLFSFLFGDILSVSALEARLAAALAAATLVVVVVFYRELFSATFDELGAVVSGIRPRAVNRLLAVMAALMIVLGIRVVGTMLVSGLLVFPAATALQVCGRFRAAVAFSAAAGVCSVLLGIFIALWLNSPPAAVIILVNAAFFAAAFLWRRCRG